MCVTTEYCTPNRHCVISAPLFCRVLVVVCLVCRGSLFFLSFAHYVVCLLCVCCVSGLSSIPTLCSVMCRCMSCLSSIPPPIPVACRVLFVIDPSPFLCLVVVGCVYCVCVLGWAARHGGGPRECRRRSRVGLEEGASCAAGRRRLERAQGEGQWYSHPSVEDTIFKDTPPVKDNLFSGMVARRMYNIRRGINLNDTSPA